MNTELRGLHITRITQITLTERILKALRTNNKKNNQKTSILQSKEKKKNSANDDCSVLDNGSLDSYCICHGN